ncbi:MAG: hypothetical protein KatS3mg039_0928 [Candidatus Kapaibacterium sp.]|nr:MAG: hypothetical protein KatS3mg039_0928 [Candidatus Kapabacteria bacterium]
MNDALTKLFASHETQIHPAVHRWLSEPSRVHRTVSGKRLQVLSPGRINPHHDGPDFLDAAILLDSVVLVGSIEFDKQRSLWVAHHHTTNARYQSVVLHVVLESDTDRDDLPEALVVPADELLNVIETPMPSEPNTTLDEIQGYALLRLLRLSAQHAEYYRNRTIREGFAYSVRTFLEQYAKKRRRPTYAAERLDYLLGRVAESEHVQFLEAIVGGQVLVVVQRLAELTRTPIADEGQHLRNEIMTNCVVPSACVLASDRDRIGVFTWYWSAEATTPYAHLVREFPLVPQRYVWQQQGMLEMLRQQHATTTVGDVFRTYGTLLALDFYRAAEEPPALEDER